MCPAFFFFFPECFNDQSFVLIFVVVRCNRANLDDPEWYDIAVVTSIIKQYFRELPTPVINHTSYPKFMAALKPEDESEKVHAIHDAVDSLPDQNKATLEYVVRHLVR